jgi:carbon-monoxide dehydrogenase medium subunit
VKPVPFAFISPESLEAVQLALQSGAGRAVVLAGGQSLVPKLNLRTVRPDMVVSLARIAKLRRLEWSNAGLVIGALTTHSDIEDIGATNNLGLLLSDIALGIGSRGIRNRATVAGCLANGDPCHDWLVAFPALGARYSVLGPNDHREIRASEWLTAPFRTSLQTGDILVSVVIPTPSSSARWGYAKVSQKINAAPIAIAALLLDVDKRNVGLFVGNASGVSSLPDVAHALAIGRPLPDLATLAERLSKLSMTADEFICAVSADAIRRAAEMALA